MGLLAAATWLDGLLGDDEIEIALSDERALDHMLAFEAALARAEAESGLIAAAAGDAIARGCEALRPDLDALRHATARDGVVVPDLVRQLRAAVGEPHAGAVHKGATSQDVIDTALALAIVEVNALLSARLDRLRSTLAELAGVHGARPLMGRTRMQAALPIRVADRMASWIEPLARHVDALEALAPDLARLQLGGPVGTRGDLGSEGDAVAARMGALLGLHASGRARHSERDAHARYASWLSELSGSLGKIGQDVVLMAENERGEVAISGGGGSSAMAHKQNPVAAETLVALARFNAVQVSGMHLALVHEQERSGAAWTLEWLILPRMMVATGVALRTAIALASSITRMGAEPRQD